MRIALTFILFFSFLFITLSSIGQETVVQDTIFTEKIKDTVHSPRKAAILSLLPGGGQVYNHIAMPKGKKKAFWKVPIIYAGLGATGYFAIQNQITQKALKNEYIYRSDNGVPSLQEYAQYDDQGILTLFENARTNRDLMIFAFIIVYGLNVLDAHVEAHFVNFDVSKDLSINIQPSMLDLKTPGVTLSFNFR